jgi:hypothetical protein
MKTFRVQALSPRARWQAALFAAVSFVGLSSSPSPAHAQNRSSSPAGGILGGPTAPLHAPVPAPVAPPLAPITKVAPLPVPTSPLPKPTPAPAPSATPAAPQIPTAQAYLATDAPARTAYGETMVPVTFFANGLGASVGPVGANRWRLLYFGTQIDFFPYQRGILVNGQQDQLSAPPQKFGDKLYLPLDGIASRLNLRWSAVPTAEKNKSVFLVQFPAAFIEDLKTTVRGDKVRTVLTLSNPTRIVAFQNKTNVSFQFAGAKAAPLPEVQHVGDYLVPNTTLKSGNWNANLQVRLNYAAPLSWFTLGNPTRIVVDAQRIFEEKTTESQGALSLIKIRRGTGHGPVQLWAAKFDPKQGWRVRVEPAGYSVLQRARPSRLAARHKAVLAVNGGFFAYDGAAVGAVLRDGEWIRLPWQGRTAVGFEPNGRATIGNLQTNAYVDFSGGLRIPIRDLNGWPDKGRVTALTRRFGTYYTLRPGEMGVVVKNGVVISTPGGGGLNVPEGGFTLIASGGARPWLQKITRGQRAKLTIAPIGWPKIMTALGGGPRLVTNSKITVKDENFRSDVRLGAGPRTAFGVDAQGRYIILVADGRKPFYSTGLTLTELAATMQKLGAVNAMNLDGGGSTALAVRGKLVNRPSDGVERGVANALMVMREK